MYVKPIRKRNKTMCRNIHSHKKLFNEDYVLEDAIPIEQPTQVTLGTRHRISL